MYIILISYCKMHFQVLLIFEKQNNPTDLRQSITANEIFLQ